MQKFNRHVSAFLTVFLTATLVIACSPSQKNPKSSAADLVLSNGKIYTMDAQQKWAEAIAITDGKILSVGTNDEIALHIGESTKLVDLKKKMVLPSFQDVHVHPMSGGLAYSGCVLFELATMDAVLAKISECVRNDPDAELIRGTGWDWSLFIGRGEPNKALLDTIENKRPLIFGDSDGHTFWVNSAALALAEIDRDTPDPEGGKIGHNTDGEPNGALMEGPAMDLVLHKIPTYTLQQKEEGLLYAQTYLNGLGITSIQDAYIGVGRSVSYRALDAYQSLQDKGQLNLRVKAAMYWEPGLGLGQIEEMKAARAAYSRDRLQVTSVKFWADGIIESYTAMLLEPYSDKPETSGFLMVPKSEMMEAVPMLDSEGFQVHIHAIGDATVRYALDAFQKARELNGVRDSRHLTAHTQLVNADDIARFAELSVVAGFSPYWAYADDYVKTINPPQLGERRMGEMYPMQSIIDSGGRIAFGSDWSVSTADPLLGIETAVSHKDPHISTDEVFIPNERISLHNAIAGYTIDAAYSNFIDAETGSIEIGKFADLVVLSENLFEIPVEQISEAEVQATVLEGELIYGAY